MALPEDLLEQARHLITLDARRPKQAQPGGFSLEIHQVANAFATLHTAEANIFLAALLFANRWSK